MTHVAAFVGIVGLAVGGREWIPAEAYRVHKPVVSNRLALQRLKRPNRALARLRPKPSTGERDLTTPLIPLSGEKDNGDVKVVPSRS